MGIQHLAMGRGIQQAMLLELADDLHQPVADLAQQADAHGLVVDEGAAAAVGADLAAKQKIAFDLEALLGEKGGGGMTRGQVELGGHARLGGTPAQQAGIGARAQRQAQSIEKDRFAGAGLAGQHAQPRREGEIEPVDQDDVADGKSEEHRLRACQKTSLSQEPGFFSGFRFFAFKRS